MVDQSAVLGRQSRLLQGSAASLNSNRIQAYGEAEVRRPIVAAHGLRARFSNMRRDATYPSELETEHS